MDLQEHFLERLPRKPYCTNSPQNGLIIRSQHIAIKHRHIQPNQPTQASWLLFDLAFVGAAIAWKKANLPAPTMTVTNPANAHAHLLYGLNTPVVTSDAGREQPIKYATAIRTAMGIKLDADPGYVGLIAKNPLHPDWRTIWTPKLYDLGELAEYVTLPRTLPKRDLSGAGCSGSDQSVRRHGSHRRAGGRHRSGHRCGLRHRPGSRRR